MYIYIILQLGSKGNARELAYNVCVYIYIYIYIYFFLLCRNQNDYRAHAGIDIITKLIKIWGVNYRGGEGVP